MIDRRFLERCEHAFENHVEKLLTANEDSFVVAVCLCGRCVPDGYVIELQRQADAARKARAWFNQHGPCWAKPLLLSYDERESAFCSGDQLRHIVAYYSHSLQRHRYDVLSHPGIFEYTRGLLVDPPDDLRDTPELEKAFPPKPLAGLKGICWRPLPHPVRSLVGIAA